MAGLCSGAFVLAAAGLLDDRPATTHYDSLDLMRWLDSSIDLRPDARSGRVHDNQLRAFPLHHRAS